VAKQQMFNHSVDHDGKVLGARKSPRNYTHAVIGRWPEERARERAYRLKPSPAGDLHHRFGGRRTARDYNTSAARRYQADQGG
jgi:hypothetical protein